MERMLDNMTEEDYDPELLSAYLDALDEKAPMPEVPDAEASFARFRKKLLSIVPEQQNTAPGHRVRGRPFGGWSSPWRPRWPFSSL